MDAILRLSYVRRHVERYAKHVMQLSPLQQPVPLGVTVPAERVQSGAEGGPSRCVWGWGALCMLLHCEM